MSFVELPLLLVSVFFAVPAAVLLVECLLAILPDASRAQQHSNKPIRTLVLVPAHNEADGLLDVLRKLKQQCRSSDELVVIADNCSDDTAAIARSAGARVIERHDPDNRGKGFAISYAVKQIDKQDSPDVVIIVDADCEISPGGVGKLATLAAARNRPIQADYLLSAANSTSRKTALSALALLVKNVVRPRGLRRAGLPCQLTGSGMAFPWTLLRDAPETGSNLVEDLQMGLDLARRGYPATSTSEVLVTSPLPVSDDSAAKQRRRWEHGYLETITSQVPSLLWEGVCTLRVSLIALALDLMVPPLALLVMFNAGLAAAAAGYWLVTGYSDSLQIHIWTLATIAIAVLLVWARFGRSTISFGALLMIPAYIFWKIPLYIAYAVGGAHREWERTDRGA